MRNPADFSKRSRRAIFLFVILMLVIVLIPRIYFMLTPPSEFTFSQTDFQKKTFSKYEFPKYEKKTYKRRKSRYTAPRSRFDPNTYAASDWVALGLSPKQASVLLKFGKRGFYSHEDLKRVFVISDEFFELIRDSLIYPEKPSYVPTYKTDRPQIPIRIEINTASEEELMSLKGIGAFYARNIIKRRNELGGFREVKQLLEVWKFDQEKLDIITPFVTVNSSLIRRINVNTASAEELKTHPYISWNVANSIVKLRAQFGPFRQLEDIRKSVLIDDVLFEKLKPYLTV